MTNLDRIEVYAGPDEHGRYHYARFWWADYHPGHPLGEHRRAERGQHFFGVLPTMTPQVDQGESEQKSNSA